MKSVYISHPFGGKAYNLTQASKWLAWAAKQPGIAPMAPWISLGQVVDGEANRELALEIDCCHIKGCEELWICGKYDNDRTVIRNDGYQILKVSAGMLVEIQFALDNNIKVRDQRQFIEQVL